MVVATVMQASCFDYALFVSGRIIGGVGNGMVSTVGIRHPIRSLIAQTTGYEHDPHLAVRACSPAPAWLPHYTIWMSDLVRNHGLLLGGLWVLLFGRLRALALPNCRESKPCCIHNHGSWSSSG
jgi:hypothetical protein